MINKYDLVRKTCWLSSFLKLKWPIDLPTNGTKLPEVEESVF